MNSSFSRLSDHTLKLLSEGLRSGRITLPSSSLQIGRLITGEGREALLADLQMLSELSFSREQVAILIDTLLQDRTKQQGSATDSIELVTSGPEAPGATNRETSVVVREMFAHAKETVMVVGYAVYQGQVVFEALARRMEELPDLDVRLFLNVSRPDGDSTKHEILLSRFAQRFKQNQWPAGARLPVVYYDPRSIADDKPIRSSLHAKCVVIDTRHVFVSSANFTEAGQLRNIEVGLRLDNVSLALKLTRHFHAMVESNQFLRAM
ncbi:DISARM system phospholipase D-like protein DrmC [Roseiconus lacunae]|uniref:DISARM system phospholipase D-like protein DrmC n=1 Tax=Roseiconus lacunae TaxID=2605694 RepID=UPI0030884C80|nr:DISARM system phospholipase D-like protein DrmC [Stieleria sp. HD01]